MVMRKMMAGMGLVALPLVSLGASVLPKAFFLIALLLGGGNLVAGPTTIFTVLAGLAALTTTPFGAATVAAAL
jgi:hypothetical protein